MNKEVGQKYKVIDNNQSTHSNVGEIVTLVNIDYGDNRSHYEEKSGLRWWLYDVDHENCEVELIEEKGEKEMSEFKENGRVVCVNNVGLENYLTLGKEYKVLYNGTSRLIEIINDQGDKESYSKKRFKLANEKTKGESMNNIKKLHKEIKNIYFNEAKRTTVIVFKNGDKVKATSSKETPFSEYAGFVTALFKYEHGLKLKDVEHLIKKKRG